MSRLPPALPGLRGAAEPRPGAGSGCTAVPGLRAVPCCSPGPGTAAGGLQQRSWHREGFFFFFFSNICILISIKEKKNKLQK